MKRRQRMFCASVIAAVATLSTDVTAQQLGPDGSIYMRSENGNLVKVAEAGHCSEARGTVDGSTLVCATLLGSNVGLSWLSPALEIYRKGAKETVIQPSEPIREWHFWNNDQQIAVYSGPADGRRPGTHELYDARSGHLLKTVVEPADEKPLPQWAKGPAELEDESISMSAAAEQERRIWIAHVLRQIATIEPGMRRKDLLRIFTVEGGISNRFQRTFVHRECPYIKVDVLFRGIEDPHNGLKEEPDDIIVSISRPYLAWMTLD